MMGIPALAFTALLCAILTPPGLAMLTGAAALVMTPGLIRCAIVGRWP